MDTLSSTKEARTGQLSTFLKTSIYLFGQKEIICKLLLERDMRRKSKKND